MNYKNTGRITYQSEATCSMLEGSQNQTGLILLFNRFFEFRDCTFNRVRPIRKSRGLDLLVRSIKGRAGTGIVDSWLVLAKSYPLLPITSTT
jgi:hypothetical protein